VNQSPVSLPSPIRHHAQQPLWRGDPQLDCLGQQAHHFGLGSGGAQIQHCVRHGQPRRAADGPSRADADSLARELPGSLDAVRSAGRHQDVDGLWGDGEELVKMPRRLRSQSGTLATDQQPSPAQTVPARLGRHHEIDASGQQTPSVFIDQPLDHPIGDALTVCLLAADHSRLSVGQPVQRHGDFTSFHHVGSLRIVRPRIPARAKLWMMPSGRRQPVDDETVLS
jgi:hypothetical protein